MDKELIYRTAVDALVLNTRMYARILGSIDVPILLRLTRTYLSIFVVFTSYLTQVSSQHLADYVLRTSSHLCALVAGGRIGRHERRLQQLRL